VPCDVGDDERRDDGANVRTGVEDARCQGPFLLREPLGYCLDRGREIPGLARPQGRPGDTETKRGPGEGVAHRRQTPNRERYRIADLRAEAIHQAPSGQQAESVRRIKGSYDVAVIKLGPMKCCLQVL
jgi:hypothetical protein